jgi:hypothetical protein
MEPVLDAAHIPPCFGLASNHVRNGLLLTKEFHTLFGFGYVTVTPSPVVRVSPHLRIDWRNGRRPQSARTGPRYATSLSERVRPQPGPAAPTSARPARLPAAGLRQVLNCLGETLELLSPPVGAEEIEFRRGHPAGG